MRRVQHEEVGHANRADDRCDLAAALFLYAFGQTHQGSKLLEINIPTAASGKIPQEMGDRDVINIDEKWPALQRAISRSSSKQLTVHLKERFKNYPPLKLYVRADASTPGKQIKEVMNIASDAGAIEVIFGVRQK